MYVIQHYKYDLRIGVHATVYAAMCAKFRSENRVINFANDRPKKLGYRNLSDQMYFRLDETTWEVIYDWCEFASEEHIRAGYWVILPPDAIPCAKAIGAPGRQAWLIASPGKGGAPSKLQLAVEWQHRTGCSQADACRIFDCSQSNFKITRDRMIARGKLIVP